MTVEKIDTSSDYFTETQVAQLLRAINPKRIGVYEKNSKLKLAHVEAYELRAHLNRILGFARWSEEVTDQQLIFAVSEERQRTDKNGNVELKDGAPVTYTMHIVCYRSIVRLTVCAPSGKVLAAYTEGATGDATLSTLGDAHDMALKTSQSQAFKRCCANLGDQFGLSLYAKGSRASLVRQTLLMPAVRAANDGVDDDVAESVPESEVVEPTPGEDKRETSAPKPPPPARESKPQLDQFRAQALQPPADVNSMWWTRLQLDVQKAGLAKAQTTDEAGTVVTLGALIQTCMRKAA